MASPTRIVEAAESTAVVERWDGSQPERGWLRPDSVVRWLVILVTVGLVALPVGFLILTAFNVGDQTQGIIQLGLANFAVIPRFLQGRLGSSVPSAGMAVPVAGVYGLE